MAKLRSKFEDHHEYIWKCDCGDWHYLEMCWDDQDPTWRSLELVDTYHAHRIRDRIKAAITILRGKPHYHSGIVLDEQTVADIIAVLSKHSGATNGES